MAQTVLTGPLAGYTKPQLLALRTEIQAEMMQGRGNLSGSSQNGQSYQFGPGLSAGERLRLVQSALAQVDPTAFPATTTIRTRFTRPC